MSAVKGYTDVVKEKLAFYQSYVVEFAQGSVKKASNAVENGKTVLYEKTKPVTTKVYGVYLGIHHTIYSLLDVISESSKKSIDYTKEKAHSVIENAKKRAETVTVKTIDLSKSLIPVGVYAFAESKVDYI